MERGTDQCGIQLLGGVPKAGTARAEGARSSERAGGLCRAMCCVEPGMRCADGCCVPAGVCGGAGGDGRPLSVAVSLLLLAFGWSAWIAVNGLWVELPLLVNELPEYWGLPAYLTVIIQVANVGPAVYVLALRLSRRRMLSVAVPTVYAMMAVGATASLLLAFFWRYQESIGGSMHSVALLALAFCLALVDCTSSVTYVPFVGALRPRYMTAFYIGEGLSGLIPCVVALVQGAGEYDCVNVTVTVPPSSSAANSSSSTAAPVSNATSWQLQAVYRPILFSVQQFFFFLCAMMVASCVAFALLAHLPGCKRERLTDAEKRRYTADTNEDGYGQQQSDASLVVTEEISKSSRKLKVRRLVVLYLLTAFVSSVTNGVLPSLQTYSVMPYGSWYYSLAVKLSQAANPVACFFTFAFVVAATWGLVVLTSLGGVMACIIIWLASQSPSPLLVGTAAGGAMIVTLWVVMTALFSYVKVNLATELAKGGKKALLWYGVVTQAGAAVGAVITFLAVTVFSLLKDAPPCPS